MQCEIILLCGTALAATIQFVVEIVLNVVMIDLSKCEIRIVFVRVMSFQAEMTSLYPDFNSITK